MNTPRWTRREFLLRALAACSAVVAGPVIVRRLAQGAKPVRSAAIATEYLGPSAAAAAKALGEAYVRRLGLKSAADVPVAATLQLIARAQGEAAAIAALVRAVQSDFRDGRVVDVDGWIISRTEGELCVMSSLAAAR